MALVSNRRSVMTLFSDPHSMHSHRVRVVVAEKNIAVDIVNTDPLEIPEDVAEVNPYGTLPTLLDRELALYESRIIMEYLDERFPHPPLLPADPVARANCRLLLYRIERDWYSLAGTITEGGKSATRARRELKDSLSSTAPIFSAKPYFMSDEFSLADASMAPLLWRLPALGIDITGNAAKFINTYAKRLFLREPFVRSLSEAEKEMRA
jgi:RNA polymerase-associated protein